MRSLSAVSCPAISCSMSPRARACESVVSMHVAGVVGHRFFRLLVRANGEALHFGEIAAALFRRHGLAHLHEMPEHLRLALRAEDSQLSELLPGGATDVRGAAERLVQLCPFCCDLGAHLGAFWQITF